jgi:hypothetical protein
MWGMGTPTAPDNKTMHLSNQTTNPWNDNVYRLGVSYNMGAGFYSLYGNGIGVQNRARFYHNSHINCVRAFSDVPRCGNIDLDAGGSVSIFNSVFYQAWSDLVTTNIDVVGESSGTVTKDFNLAFAPGGSVTFVSPWTDQAHEQSNVDPRLTNVGSLDFTLQSDSGARGVGGALTTTSGSGSSSTSLTVAAGTGSFFIGDNSSNLPQYGGTLAPGDTITVGSTAAQVSSVSGDVITLASPVSWSSGASVYFGSSTTIDVGAYPYKAGGYTLSATYATAGGTVTITPNDASLVRFVVCYRDTIPYAIDNSSPYTCAQPTGTFAARVYPRYASATRWVVATP